MTILPTPSSFWFALVLTFACAHSSFAARHSSGLELLLEQYQQAHAEFSAAMEQWAKFCEDHSYLTDAERLRMRASDPSLGLLDYDDLPEERLPDLPPRLQGAEKQWRTAIRKIESDYAVRLYQLARRAIDQRHASLAFQLVRELVYHDPDHEFGRRLLGYVRDGDRWTTRFERIKAQRGFIDHPQFGWIPAAQRDRYENGERFFNGRWIPLQKELALRKDFRNGWEVESEHFLIKTNHSLERGVEISRQLELFHRYFIREFAAFFNTPVQMQSLFGATSPRATTSLPQYRINYYANREDFVLAMNRYDHQVPIATGFYLPSQRTSFFYHDDDPENADTAMGTMFHEVTHQILGESNRRIVEVGTHRDFWVIEGIACYMESFRVEEVGRQIETGTIKRRVHIGDPTHPRMYWARQVALVEQAHVPMERFVDLGKDSFFAGDHDLLHAYYSQASGMVHFFLHFENGRYRDAFIEYLSQVYSPSDRIRLRHDSLAQMVGIPFATLDQQYQDYLRSLQVN